MGRNRKGRKFPISIYCSKGCSDKGRIVPNLCKTCGKDFKRTSHDKILYCSKECYPDVWNKGLKGYSEGEKNGMWKGNEVGYTALHDWVKYRLGTARDKECVYCGSEDYVDWANVSHEYKRDLTDWMPLCRKCHFKYDEQNFGRSVRNL
jgi:hypothetical protein